jgi:hypothetical protein
MMCTTKSTHSHTRSELNNNGTGTSGLFVSVMVVENKVSMHCLSHANLECEIAFHISHKVEKDERTYALEYRFTLWPRCKVNWRRIKFNKCAVQIKGTECRIDVFFASCRFFLSARVRNTSNELLATQNRSSLCQVESRLLLYFLDCEMDLFTIFSMGREPQS